MIRLWQEVLLERLPANADIRFGEDGGEFQARFGRWEIESPWACAWTTVRGPGIYDRIAITGPTYERLDQMIAVLTALGAPIRPGRSFESVDPLRGLRKGTPPTSESGVSAGPDGRR